MELGAIMNRMIKGSVSLKKKLIAATGIILFVVLAVLVWSAPTEAVLTIQLRQAAAEELQPLVPAVNALMQGAEPERRLDCFRSKQTYTKAHLFCRDMFVYPYESSAGPLPASLREDVVAQAETLDSLLEQNGWKPDRPQDKEHTVVDTIPSAPLEAFHGKQIPFHKNVRDGISCNLVIGFSGPTDGTSPGEVNVTRFSCQKHYSFLQLNTSTYTRGG